MPDQPRPPLSVRPLPPGTLRCLIVIPDLLV